MQLRRIEISAFRCFKNSVVIDNIGDGVTLLVGDNEEGKSTVLAALQAVLFEKHGVGGAVADGMLPYGSKVRPEIKLEFDHDGEHYMLRKAFCQKPAAELEAAAGGRWSGDAAEERLREMLEFTAPGRGGAKPEHRGLQALFWVEQGLASRQPYINETAQTSLAGALETEVGTITGGERGRTLIKRIESRINEILTPKTRKPSGDYKAAIDQAIKSRDARDGFDERLNEFEEKIDALTRVRDLLNKLEADDPIGVADERLEKATNAVRNVDDLKSNLETAMADLKSARSGFELANLRLVQRQNDRRESNKTDQKVRELKVNEIAVEQAINDDQKAFNDAESTYKKARTALEATRKAALSADQLASFLGKKEKLVAAKERLEKAELAEQNAKKLTTNVEANAFTTKVIKALRHLDGKHREETARLQAIATLLELTPDKERRATIQGETIIEASLTLIEPTQIELEGYGAIRVTPGGEDLSRRRETAKVAASQFERALEKHGADDLHHAERQASDRQSWLEEARIHQNTVEAHAPDGLDTLREEVAGLEADVVRIEARLGNAVAPGTSADKASVRADYFARKLDDANSHERTASDDLKDAENILKTSKINLNTATGHLEEGEIAAKNLSDQLTKSAGKKSDADLEKMRDNATKAEEDASKIFNGITIQLAESDPDEARREIKIAKEARGKVEKNLQGLRENIGKLEGELQGLGQHDTAAELEVAEGELERAEAQEARLDHETRALTLLYDSLVEEERVARETFLAPVRDRIEPYLKRLFPGSHLMLDDQTLEITHLRRDGQDEPYERLSIGTREQLAVLVRLAFADLLDEHDKKSPIILDDALVFSDDRRFEEMLRILDRAAERLQIIVLTCHERAYFGRGWTTRRLQNFKSGVEQS